MGETLTLFGIIILVVLGVVYVFSPLIIVSRLGTLNTKMNDLLKLLKSRLPEPPE